jgi:hypothetical protein
LRHKKPYIVTGIGFTAHPSGNSFGALAACDFSHLFTIKVAA